MWPMGLLLNMECFESVVPAIFLSYAPTFFNTKKIRVCSNEGPYSFLVGDTRISDIVKPYRKL